MNGALRLLAHALLDPTAFALDPIVGPALTYRDLAGAVDSKIMRLSQSGCDRSSAPVVLVGDYSLDMIVSELALLAMKSAVLPLPGFLSPAQRGVVISEFGSRLVDGVVIHRKWLSRCDVSVCDHTQTAWFTIAAGADGRLKSICHGAEHLLTVADAMVMARGSLGTNRHLAILPPGTLLETVAGLFATLLAGGTYICPPQGSIGMADPYHPKFPVMVAFIAQHRVTSMILVPELLTGLVHAMEAMGLRLPDLAIVVVAGDCVPPAILVRAQRLGLPVRQGYALTEAGSLVTLEAAAGDPLGAVGRILPHLVPSVAADGEIVLDIPPRFGVPDRSRGSSPLYTGLVGRIDQTGSLWIDGRKSGLIGTSHGHTIAPEWVEDCLLAQPGVAQAMVYGEGMPLPHALLVPTSPLADLDAAVARANANLPAYARIEQWREVGPFTDANGLLAASGTLIRDAIGALWLDGEPAFFERLEAATYRERLAFLASAQSRAGSRGEIHHQAHIACLSQIYHLLRMSMTLVRAARARLVHRPDLATALEVYEGERPGCKAMILDVVMAVGGLSALVFDADAYPAARGLIDHADHAVRDGNAVAIVGMAYALESVGMALLRRGSTGSATDLDLSWAAAQAFENLVNSVADPDDQAAVVTMARTIFGLLGVVFAAIPPSSRYHAFPKADAGFARKNR